MLQLFDCCFKQGVIDSCDTEDDYFVREWYEEKKESWQYGVLSDPDIVYDWRRWRYTLLRWCRLRALRKLGEQYLDPLQRGKTFQYGVIPMCMRFYLMGVEEWLEYPNPMKIEIFKQRTRTHWKPVPKNLEKIETDDFIHYCQEIAYKFDELPESKRKEIMAHSKLQGFVQSLWQFTRRFPTYGKIRVSSQSEEEI